MTTSKNRIIASLISNDTSKIKEGFTDSDSIVSSASLGVTAAAGTATYSSSDTLPVSANNGDQALVTSTNRLYIFTNGGWYNIALVNTSPYFTTSPNASYELSNTGAQTNIEILAVDSEGINITYSTVADSDFSTFATITKDSDNGRRFTITVDSDQSVGATGTVTFRASDGVNIASALSTFSVEFLVTNSNYSTLLIKADSDGTDNQVDASSIGRTLTEAGNVTSTAFTPYHPGRYSYYFAGDTGDYFTIESPTSALSFGTDTDFCIEMWLYPFDASASHTLVDMRPDSTNGAYIGTLAVGDYPSGSTKSLSLDFNAINYLNSSNNSVKSNEWNHLVLNRHGDNINLFVNGTREATTSLEFNFLVGKFRLFKNAFPGGGIADGSGGYIRDYRVVKGDAVYGSGTSLTMPTEPLTAITGTSILLFQNPYVNEVVGTETVSFVGGETKRFGPYDYLGYTNAEYGGSVYFDGTGDYITTPADTTNLTMSGDFTIDFWIYPTSAYVNDFIYGKWNNNTDGWAIFATTDWSSGNFGSLTFYYGNYGSNESATNIRTEKIKQNQWNHCRITRDNNVFYMAINGVVGARSNYGSNGLSWSDTRTFNANATIGIGGNTSYSKGPGYMAELRVINGTALSRDSDFTPPTAPVTAVTNTKLLTCTNKHSIWDAGIGSLLTIAGNTTASNTQRKFTSSSAIYFDGTGDYLTAPNAAGFNFGSGNFTVECWAYLVGASTGTSQSILSLYDSGNNRRSYQLQRNGGGNNIRFYYSTDGSTPLNIADATTVTTGNNLREQWIHLAAVRNGNTLTLYVDGTSQASATVSGSLYENTSDPLVAGAAISGSASNYLNGYIQNVRITKGLARYTSNFTPPTTEFKG